MEFLLQPGVYRTGDASTLLKLLDNMWIKDHSVGAGTLYIISGFANYNGCSLLSLFHSSCPKWR